MPGPWNDATDRQLLLSIIHLSAPQLPQWNQVAALMGEGYTAESTRQHFQKMRKDCKAKFGDLGNATPGPETKSTPRKSKTAKANGETPSKSTGKRKSKKDVADEQDDEEVQSPSKKVKSDCAGHGGEEELDFV
ncbi:hypothetical protein LTR08_003187 [Meristemomyces frigidus]|nr:hypothetical protein LTR08_003187 [Meristemomyces frigidus]